MSRLGRNGSAPTLRGHHHALNRPPEPPPQSCGMRDPLDTDPLDPIIAAPYRVLVHDSGGHVVEIVRLRSQHPDEGGKPGEVRFEREVTIPEGGYIMLQRDTDVAW